MGYFFCTLICSILTMFFLFSGISECKDNYLKSLKDKKKYCYYIRGQIIGYAYRAENEIPYEFEKENIKNSDITIWTDTPIDNYHG